MDPNIDAILTTIEYNLARLRMALLKQSLPPEQQRLNSRWQPEELAVLKVLGKQGLTEGKAVIAFRAEFPESTRTDKAIFVAYSRHRNAAAIPEVVEPEAIEPEAIEPEAIEPGAVVPEVVEPEVVEPEVVVPEAVEPEVVVPEAVEPEVVVPEVVVPEVVEPETVVPKKKYSKLHKITPPPEDAGDWMPDEIRAILLSSSGDDASKRYAARYPKSERTTSDIMQVWYRCKDGIRLNSLVKTPIGLGRVIWIDYTQMTILACVNGRDKIWMDPLDAGYYGGGMNYVKM